MDPALLIASNQAIVRARKRSLALICCSLVACGSKPARATSEYWTGGTNGYSWNYVNNWSGMSGVAPYTTALLIDPGGEL
jgi:hypothetical protein